MELWIMESYNIKQWNKRHWINIGVLTRKEPHVSPLAFCNVDIVLIREYFPNVTLFNLKIGSIDVLRLGKGFSMDASHFDSLLLTRKKNNQTQH